MPKADQSDRRRAICVTGVGKVWTEEHGKEFAVETVDETYWFFSSDTSQFQPQGVYIIEPTGIFCPMGVEYWRKVS